MTNNGDGSGNETQSIDRTVRGNGIYFIISLLKGLQEQVNSLEKRLCTLEGKNNYNLSTQIGTSPCDNENDNSDSNEDNGSNSNEDNGEEINSEIEDSGGSYNPFIGIQESLQRLNDKIDNIAESSGICETLEGQVIQTLCEDGGSRLKPVTFSDTGIKALNKSILHVSRQITELHTLICQEMVPTIYTPPQEGPQLPQPPNNDDEDREEETEEIDLSPLEEKLDRIIELLERDIRGESFVSCAEGSSRSWGGSRNAIQSVSEQIERLHTLLYNTACSSISGDIPQYPLDLSFRDSPEEEEGNTQGGTQ